MSWVFRLLVLVLVLESAAWADEKERFDKYMANTRALIEKQHLIATVTYEPPGEKDETSYRYDHYPDLERLQMKEGTWARKKGGPWLKSEDWAKTGSKVKPDKAQELSYYASVAMVPTGPVSPPKDLSQGAQVYDLEKTEPLENAERLFVRITREHPTNFGYPQFVFHRYKDEDNALLEGFAGNFNLPDGKAHVNITYGFLIQINAKVEVVGTPTPAVGKKKKK